MEDINSIDPNKWMKFISDLFHSQMFLTVISLIVFYIAINSKVGVAIINRIIGKHKDSED